MKTYLWHFTSYNGFLGIVSSKELWMRNTMKMNDINDRTYGKKSVTDAIETCNEDNILYKYKRVNILLESPLFNHYSMSFCLHENPNLWKTYAHQHQGVALLFNIDELENAIYDKCGLSAKEVLNFRPIYYDLSVSEIEKICITLEDRFLKDCIDMHRLELIKKLLFQICTGYTKESKWGVEDEFRICYVDEYSAKNKDIRGEILRLLNTDRKTESLSKIGMAPKQRLFDKYALHLGCNFTSSVLPFVYIGKECKISKSQIFKLLQKNGFDSTQVLKEGDII